MEFNTNKYDVQAGTDRLMGINEDGKIKLDELKALNGMNLKGMIDWSAKERTRVKGIPDTESSKEEFVGVLDKFDAQIDALKKNYEASKSEIQTDAKDELAKLEAAIGIAKPKPAKEAGTTIPGATPAKPGDKPVAAPSGNAENPAKAETVKRTATPDDPNPKNADGTPICDNPALPCNDPKAAETDKAGRTEYVVKKGDNLTKIAREHGTTVDALVQENGIKDRGRIFVDQKLKVPAKAESKPATDTEAAKAATKPEAGKNGKAAEGKTEKKAEAPAKPEEEKKPVAKAGEVPPATATVADKAKAEAVATKPGSGPLDMTKAAVDQGTLKSASFAGGTPKSQKA